MDAGSRDIPLSTLPSAPPRRSTNQAPTSSTTGIQVQQCPTISNIPPALPSLQSALAKSPLPSATALPPAPTSGPPSTLVPPSRRYQRWCHAITKQCSSVQIEAVVALIALGVGVYYYYGQYMISWKTWEVGIWKDCRDRADIANSSVCHRYANISYDQIARQTDKRSYVAPTTDSVRMAMALKDSFLLLGWFIISTESVAMVYDTRYMGSRHNFPQSVYLVSFVIVSIFVPALLSPSGTYGSTFREICLGVSHDLDLSKELQWKRNLLWGLIWEPIGRTLSPAACLLCVHYAIRLFMLQRDFQNMSDVAFRTLYVALAAIMAVLSLDQSIIPQTGMKVDFDYEAQFHCIVRVSRGIPLEDSSLSFREKKNR